MAGLRLEPECHAGIVLCHHLVQEAPGLHRNALVVRLALGVPATLVGFLGVPAQAQLSHDAFKSLPDVVLHGGGRFDELAVKHGSTGTTL